MEWPWRAIDDSSNFRWNGQVALPHGESHEEWSPISIPTRAHRVCHRPLDAEERWRIARQLLNNDSFETKDRVAGLMNEYHLCGLARQAGAADPRGLTDLLMLIIDGLSVNGAAGGRKGLAPAGVTLAEEVIRRVLPVKATAQPEVLAAQ
ncbi:hypothetical protein [Streptomyces sp. NPDC091215]|uniref:hypothetical protein n=1 Tax=Streptomyces sp. NPDC091215 TaxID=3155192 RepID=UPI003433E1AC